MKIPVIIILASALLTSCSRTDHHVSKTKYDYVLYETLGGPFIEFKVFPTKNRDAIRVQVERSRFIDKQVQIEFKKDKKSKSLYKIFEKVLQNKLPLEKKEIPEEPMLDTGSWTHIYAINKEQKLEITNPEIQFVFDELCIQIEKKLKDL